MFLNAVHPCLKHTMPDKAIAGCLVHNSAAECNADPSCGFEKDHQFCYPVELGSFQKHGVLRKKQFVLDPRFEAEARLARDQLIRSWVWGKECWSAQSPDQCTARPGCTVKGKECLPTDLLRHIGYFWNNIIVDEYKAQHDQQREQRELTWNQPGWAKWVGHAVLGLSGVSAWQLVSNVDFRPFMLALKNNPHLGRDTLMHMLNNMMSFMGLAKPGKMLLQPKLVEMMTTTAQNMFGNAVSVPVGMMLGDLVQRLTNTAIDGAANVNTKVWWLLQWIIPHCRRWRQDYENELRSLENKIKELEVENTLVSQRQGGADEMRRLHQRFGVVSHEDLHKLMVRKEAAGEDVREIRDELNRLHKIDASVVNDAVIDAALKRKTPQLWMRKLNENRIADLRAQIASLKRKHMSTAWKIALIVAIAGGSSYAMMWGLGAVEIGSTWKFFIPITSFMYSVIVGMYRELVGEDLAAAVRGNLKAWLAGFKVVASFFAAVIKAVVNAPAAAASVAGSAKAAAASVAKKAKSMVTKPYAEDEELQQISKVEQKVEQATAEEQPDALARRTIDLQRIMIDKARSGSEPTFNPDGKYPPISTGKRVQFVDPPPEPSAPPAPYLLPSEPPKYSPPPAPSAPFVDEFYDDAEFENMVDGKVVFVDGKPVNRNQDMPVYL